MSLLLTSSEHVAQRAVVLTMGSRITPLEGHLDNIEITLCASLAVCSRKTANTSVSGLAAHTSSQSGSAGRGSHHEAAVFIICRELLRLLSAPILEDAQTTTLAGGGHEPHRSLFKVNPHVSSLSGNDIAKLSFSSERKMSLASKIADKFRARLKRLVEKERQQIGCATQAVKRVAGRLKMSPATVYRIMNGYGEVQIKAHQYAELLMHSLGIVKAAASRMRAKRHAASIHA